MYQKKVLQNEQKPPPAECEVLKSYWTVDNMFTFENVGFSHTVEKAKYLTCADCDMGPVGYYDIPSGKCFIALKRVKHAS